MVDVIVSFRDAVFAALMSWGGVADDPGIMARNNAGEETPVSTPAPVEKATEASSRSFC